MKRRFPEYNLKVKQVSRMLRKNMTLAEIILWQHLRRRQMKRYQFLRQKPIDNFVVDFFCKELMLAIEIDGESHVGREKKDQERQRKLEAMGVRFLRFLDEDVKENVGAVLSVTGNWIDEYEQQERR